MVASAAAAASRATSVVIEPAVAVSIAAVASLQPFKDSCIAVEELDLAVGVARDSLRVASSSSAAWLAFGGR